MGRRARGLAAIAAATIFAGIAAGCASRTPAPPPAASVAESRCAEQVDRVYFPREEVVMSGAALVVVSNAAATLTRCADLPVFLVSVPGLGVRAVDGLLETRAGLVKAALEARGVAPDRIRVVTSGPRADAAERAPMGQVLIVVEP